MTRPALRKQDLDHASGRHPGQELSELRRDEPGIGGEDHLHAEPAGREVDLDEVRAQQGLAAGKT